MQYMRVLLGLTLAGLVTSAVTVQAADKMDCNAMFRKAESKISEKKEAPVEKKAELYEMALKAYQQCKQGKMQKARDFFNQVFDTSDRM